MIRLTPVLAGTALAVTGALGFEEFKHKEITVYVHHVTPGTVGHLTGQAARGTHAGVFEHRELTPIRQLRDGVERLQYPAVVDALSQSPKTLRQG